MADHLHDLQTKDTRFHIHPFTNHGEMHATGTHIIQSGEGCYLTDQNDRRLLDGLAGLWCVNVGYNCREIVEAVHNQMERLPYYPSFFNSTTEPPILVAEFLAHKAPARLNHTIFSNSGSEANETALKTIRYYNKLLGRSQKHKILSRQYAYHGVTLATSSMTGLPNCNLPFDLPFESFLHAPAPYPYGAKSDLTPEAYGKWCLEETVKLIEKEGADTIAAMFVEPIQGAGGVIVPPVGYLQELHKIARENDILFVADEVITAFGRLGDWFASNLWNLDPDLMILAKGITSGYLPLGATMVSDEIVETIYGSGYFSHGFTYTGHTTCSAAALANLHYLERNQIIPRVNEDTGPYFHQKLLELSTHRAVAEVRGHQLIGAMELVPKEGREALTPTTLLGVRAAAVIRQEGVIVRGIRDLIALAPPLIITRAEIDELFDGVRRGLDRLWD